MKRFFTIIAAVLLIMLRCVSANAFTLLDPQTWPPALDPRNWPFTLFPVPEVATNPNGGVTYGVLFAFLFKDKQNQINYIFAPDINNNTDLGAGGTVRFFAYPSENTQWYALAGAQENIARLVDLNYQTGRTHQSWWSFNGRFFFERDPTERFFGMGNDSRLGGESNYTTEQVYGFGLFGWNITPQLQLAFVTRPRYVRILRGAFTSIPQTTTIYPNVKGVGGGSEFYNELRVTYDSRNSIEIPREGSLFVLYGGNADRSFFSSMSYNRFGIDLHHYWTLSKRITLAGHGYIQYMPSGNEAPFWSRARLGGEESLLYDQQTLRGYGVGRFIDNNLSVANFELRTRIFEADLFNTHGILEVAPFAEAGRVFHRMSEDPVGDLHPVGGIGFRAIAEPFVVGYVDIGFGGEGAAVFSGINYPF